MKCRICKTETKGIFRRQAMCPDCVLQRKRIEIALEKIRQCPICNSNQFTKLDKPIKESRYILKRICSKCGYKFRERANETIDR